MYCACSHLTYSFKIGYFFERVNRVQNNIIDHIYLKQKPFKLVEVVK